jgi:hypothetical protein
LVLLALACNLAITHAALCRAGPGVIAELVSHICCEAPIREAPTKQLAE